MEVLQAVEVVIKVEKYLAGINVQIASCLEVCIFPSAGGIKDLSPNLDHHL